MRKKFSKIYERIRKKSGGNQERLALNVDRQTFQEKLKVELPVDHQRVLDQPEKPPTAGSSQTLSDSYVSGSARGLRSLLEHNEVNVDSAAQDLLTSIASSSSQDTAKFLNEGANTGSDSRKKENDNIETEFASMFPHLKFLDNGRISVRTPIASTKRNLQGVERDLDSDPPSPTLSDILENPSDDDVVKPRMLTQVEHDELQSIANNFDMRIIVFGSRAKGLGRNINDTSLPVGKGPETRSDIDVMIVHDWTRPISWLHRLGDEIAKVGGGAGKLSLTYRDSSHERDNADLPLIIFRQGQSAKLYTSFKPESEE